MLNEDHIARAAAQGFDAHRACTRVGIEKICARHTRTKDVKQSFAQLVGGGAQIPTLQGAQAKTAVSAGNDSHKSSG
jgi:hypothetical protein